MASAAKSLSSLSCVMALLSALTAAGGVPGGNATTRSKVELIS